eukprot:TRINITY_DN4017_c0_g2_i1.p1 TRINITY_DN4017_c0_g2~~TRINITY_DN4017_c0_g2_i1.p1  ORF type:complete len:366 (+),score=42.36 TRINITY_DN4017_c0_g2_i1:51-1148(+)
MYIACYCGIRAHLVCIFFFIFFFFFKQKTAYEMLRSLVGSEMCIRDRVRLLEVDQANYERDVVQWADGIALGSPVYNGNPSPRILEFVNSFDFQDDLTRMVGGTFATGAGAASGIESTMGAMERGLRTFGVVTVGGPSWRNAEGTGIDGGEGGNSDQYWSLALSQGQRIAQLADKLRRQPPVGPGTAPAPITGVTDVLNSVAVSLGRGRWSPETRISSTCESYCRGWSAAVGCGTCKRSAFSFPGGDSICIHPGPLGTGLLCRVNQTTLEVTGESCCGVGGPCELPKPSAWDFLDTSTQWPGGCCAGAANCAGCPGGSPLSDRFPLLNDTRTLAVNRRYFDYNTNTCMEGVRPVNASEGETRVPA